MAVLTVNTVGVLRGHIKTTFSMVAAVTGVVPVTTVVVFNLF